MKDNRLSDTLRDCAIGASLVWVLHSSRVFGLLGGKMFIFAEERQDNITPMVPSTFIIVYDGITIIISLISSLRKSKSLGVHTTHGTRAIIIGPSSPP